MSRRALFGLLTSLLIGKGCQASTAPYDDIASRLEVDRTRVAGGELLGLRAIATVDSGILEPGETDTLPCTWTVPSPTGTYRLWAGGRVREGLVFGAAGRPSGASDRVI